MVEPTSVVATPAVVRRLRLPFWRGGTGLSRTASILTVLSLLLTLLLPTGIAFAQDDDEDDETAAGEPPAGEYTVAITDDDIPQDLVGGPDLIGRWQIFLRPDGSYSIGRADIGVVVTGSYTVEDETITVTDEDGLLSCVNAIPTAGPDLPVETATYTWDLGSGGLTLLPVTEGCQGRKLVLSTRPLDLFVACNTVAVPLTTGAEGDDATSAATPEPAATPDEGDEDTIPVIDNPFGGDDDEEADAADEDGATGGDASDLSEDDVEAGIDGLLGQLSACWATQDPARIIPLFGSEFLDALLEDAGSLQDVGGIFGQIMVVPINWERSGPVDSEDGAFSAIVALTIGGEESFQRYSFVFEDGAWFLDSFGF